jgi:hypothetical protein
LGERLAGARFRAVDLRAAGLRAVAGLARFGATLAREAVDFGAAALFALVAVAFLRGAAALRLALERLGAALALADPVAFHLPDITRCAASATASAISAPSLVALAAMLLAARSALSAASRPASRIALRAFGLALIAAAAAARPAASISLLIATFTIFSAVVFDLDVELDELFLACLAMAFSLHREKTL